MLLNLYLYIFFYIFILFSTLGYGFLFLNLGNYTKNYNNLGYVGLFGIFFMLGYSYASNLILAHSKLHNLIFLSVGIIFFLYFYFKNNKNLKKEFFLIFFLLIIASFLFKTHDDFPYYHFPYSYYLTQTDFMIGVGQFNHGFRTPSSIFYINSLVYLPLIEFNLIHMPSLMIMGFVNLVLLEKIHKNFNNEKINFTGFYCLMAIMFINIFFYRISEHGTDRSAQILIFVLILEILLFNNFTLNKKHTINKLYILMGLIISLKAFYILYLLFLLPILHSVFKKMDYKNFFDIFFKNIYFTSFIFIVFFVLLNNFFNSGCFIYPINITCITNVSWSIPLSEVSSMNDWYEQWSKGGAGPNFRVENPTTYIQDFNWLSNWIEVYFFTKVSDFLLGIFVISLILFIVFYSKEKRNINLKNNLTFTYLILILLFLEWFYNHPALRYGGYTLICLLIFVPLSNILEKMKNSFPQVKSKFIFLICLVFIIFTLRNVNRISDEIEKYDYKPLKNVFYNIDDHHYRITNNFDELKNNYENCILKKDICNKKKHSEITKIKGKYIFKNRR
jgi:hypothetical protein